MSDIKKNELDSYAVHEAGFQAELMAARLEMLDKTPFFRGFNHIDIKMSAADPKDFLGLPMVTDRDAYNAAEDKRVEAQLNILDLKPEWIIPPLNPIVIFDDCDPVIREQFERTIHVGDRVMMEIAQDCVEFVQVTNIADGIVYGLSDDGEPYCALISGCDKVPN